MKNFVCGFLVLGFLLPLSAQARPYHITSVRWIVATRNKITYDDRYVTIVGHVTRRMGDEEYWFTDGTGSVRLDSENFDLPVGPRLLIGGRIDQAYLGFGHIEVDVRKWHYAPLHHVTPSATIARLSPTRTSAPLLTPPPPKPPAPEAPVSIAPAPAAPSMSTPAETPATNAAPTLAPPSEASTPTPTSAPASASVTTPPPASTTTSAPPPASSLTPAAPPPASPAPTVPTGTNAANPLTPPTETSGIHG